MISERPTAMSDAFGSKSAAGYEAPNNIVLENNFFDAAQDNTGGPTYYAVNIRECTNCTIRYNSWLQPPRLPDTRTPASGTACCEVALNVKVTGNAGPYVTDPMFCTLPGVTFAYNVWVGIACGATDKNVPDVHFVDPAKLDLHLKSDSPAIDAGSPTDFPAADIDGDHRPAGAAPDAGADERP